MESRTASPTLTLGLLPTKGFAMSVDHEHPSQEKVPSRDEHDTPELEADQNLAPRPEEEIADALRSEPAAHESGKPSE